MAHAGSGPDDGWEHLGPLRSTATGDQAAAQARWTRLHQAGGPGDGQERKPMVISSTLLNVPGAPMNYDLTQLQHHELAGGDAVTPRASSALPPLPVPELPPASRWPSGMNAASPPNAAASAAVAAMHAEALHQQSLYFSHLSASHKRYPAAGTAMLGPGCHSSPMFPGSHVSPQ